MKTKKSEPKTISKKMRKLKQYFTHPNLAEKICYEFVQRKDVDILEPSCGDGVFFNFLPKDRNIVAYEIDTKLEPIINKRLNKIDSYVNLHFEDFLTAKIHKKFDLIIGNPPYGTEKRGQTAMELLFIKKCLTLLKDDGHIVFILQTKTLNGVGNYENIWGSNGRLHTLTPLVRRPKFSGTGKTSEYDTCIFEIKKRKKSDFTNIAKLQWIEYPT